MEGSAMLRSSIMQRKTTVDVGGAALKPPLSFLEEWRASGVEDSITLANVRYYEGREALALITEHAIAQCQKVTSYATEPAKRILKRNENVEAGGWFVAGLDPLNNWNRMEYGQFKPNVPRIDSTKGKPIKYQSPEGMEARAIFLDVPDDPHYWAKIHADPSIALTYVEGAKKAGLLLSLGIPAVALPGIWMGGRWRDKEGNRLINPHLIPEIAALAQPGRKINIWFDEDEKPKTRREVANARAAFSKLLEAAGCEVWFIRHDQKLGKAVDDIWSAHGADKVRSIVAGATVATNLIAARQDAFDEQFRPSWEKNWKLTDSADKTIERFDGWTPTFSFALARTIGVKGGLGSGKTEALINSIIAEVLSRGEGALQKGKDALQVFLMSPTNPLNAQLESRTETATHLSAELQKLGTDLPVIHFQDDVVLAREMMRDGYPGIYVGCKESFSDYHMDQTDWSRFIVAIDEVSSFRMDTPTAKSKLLPELLRMLEQAHILIGLDKFFSDADARVLRMFRGEDAHFLAQNEKLSTQLIHWIESRTKEGKISLAHKGVGLTLLKERAAAGLPLDRVAIASDNLLELKIIEQWLLAQYGKQGMARVSSETVEASHLFMPNPDGYIVGQKIHYLLYSPTIQSGLDIQEDFDLGILICTGVLPPTKMIQMLGRCRNCPEWFVSAPRFTQDAVLSFKALDPSVLKRWQHQAENSFMRLKGAKGDRRMNAWAAMNQAMSEIERKFYSECIYALLQDGYQTIDTVEVAQSGQLWDAFRDMVKDKEARLHLTEDRVHGQELRDEQRAPSKDSEVWEIKAAEIYEKYPAYVKKLRLGFASVQEKLATDYQSFDLQAATHRAAELQDNLFELEEALEHALEEVDVARRIYNSERSPESLDRLNAAKSEIEALEECVSVSHDELLKVAADIHFVKHGESEYIEQMRMLISGRIERIYEGEKARQNNSQDKEHILDGIKNYFTSSASKRYQTYRNAEFFNRLNLEGLEFCGCKDDWKLYGIGAKGAFQSPEIVSRYEDFQSDEELLELFPEVDGVEGFWSVVKRILKGYGYQSSGGTAWREVAGIHPNGRDRNDNQRFTTGRKSVYLLVFLRMECSGGALFKELLPVLMDAIRDRIERERVKFTPKDQNTEAWGESHTPPGQQWRAAA